MKLGVMLPLVDIGGEPADVREVAEAAESLGYDFLATPDHVLGVNKASRPDWGDRNTSADLFHDPFVLFGYLSGVTRKVGFSTEVLILPQRQTALVAKQAAEVDVLTGGRSRLGIGVGWNDVEYQALNENFHNPVAAEVKFPSDIFIRHRIVDDYPGFVPLKHPPGLVEHVSFEAAAAH